MESSLRVAHQWLKALDEPAKPEDKTEKNPEPSKEEDGAKRYSRSDAVAWIVQTIKGHQDAKVGDLARKFKAFAQNVQVENMKDTLAKEIGVKAAQDAFAAAQGARIGKTEEEARLWVVLKGLFLSHLPGTRAPSEGPDRTEESDSKFKRFDLDVLDNMTGDKAKAQNVAKVFKSAVTLDEPDAEEEKKTAPEKADQTKHIWQTFKAATPAFQAQFLAILASDRLKIKGTQISMVIFGDKDPAKAKQKWANPKHLEEVSMTTDDSNLRKLTLESLYGTLNAVIKGKVPTSYAPDPKLLAAFEEVFGQK